MITLYQASGAGDFLSLGARLSPEETRKLLFNAARVLRARNLERTAYLLESLPFQLIDATNDFSDSFAVLYARVPLDQYEELRGMLQDSTQREAFAQIADVVTEIGPYIRFIVAELALESPTQHPPGQGGLTLSEINKLVYRYIGVSQGYLGDFTYRTHHEFYIDLGLDINPYDFQGTTRERFIEILKSSPHKVQAIILEGVLKRFPVGSSELRTQERHNEIRAWISRLRGAEAVETPTLEATSEVVEVALRDAQQLLQASRAASAVDRVHTALHGYMQVLCERAGTPVPPDASVTQLFKVLRDQHPAFHDRGPRSADVDRVLRSLGAIIDTLNPLRNRASVAHPSPDLLPDPEAMLVVNTVRTILHYVDSKVREHDARRRDQGRA